MSFLLLDFSSILKYLEPSRLEFNSDSAFLVLKEGYLSVMWTLEKCDI